MSTTNRWGTTDPIEADAGPTTDRTVRVAVSSDSVVLVSLSPIGSNLVADSALVPDQNEGVADIAARATRQNITIQNTGVDVLQIGLGANTAAGTRGLVLKACTTANDGTGGIYTTTSGLAIWIYAKTLVAPACQVEEEYT